MAIRLTSFLSGIENSLGAGSAVLKGGSWDNRRTINYPLGLARYILAARTAAGTEVLGSILVQAFDLGHGASCLRASLFWTGKEDSESVHAIYEHDGIDWAAEAAQVAELWLAGPQGASEGVHLEVAEPLAAAS